MKKLDSKIDVLVEDKIRHLLIEETDSDDILEIKKAISNLVLEFSKVKSITR